ncbi:hypothetical protein LguiB_017592 [Lonicera macranthoides]
MWSFLKVFILQFLWFLLFDGFLGSQAKIIRYKFVVNETPYTRLCSTKNILTVNGQYPGPTLYAHRGDTLVVDVHNRGDQNITIHWHGVKQQRNPWSDGPEYITQCPIQPGANFSQKIILTNEEGTLWWHAHSDWSRATVHGAFFIYPPRGISYAFPTPHAEFPIILGDWWRNDIQAVLNQFLASGGDPQVSDALTINGQPGDLYPCSRSGTFNRIVERGKNYLLRMVNAGMNNIFFFAIANHTLTVVGVDASYVKPLNTTYIAISPGQTIDVLLEANQPIGRYYMAARAYSSAAPVPFDNTTTTAIITYRGTNTNTSSPPLPDLPLFNDENASVNFTGSLRGLAVTQSHPGKEPKCPSRVATKLLFTLSINLLPCNNGSCAGPNNSRFAASVNNITFDSPTIDILEAYYKRINGVYGDDFPRVPPVKFNYTSDFIPVQFQISRNGTEVRELEFNSAVELVFQGTNVVAGIDHPMHLHGYSFYVVGWGLGNFDKVNDPLRYNLVDPPLQNTIAVPRNGWTAIRFIANNPGVWLLHCHLERHISWGMEMTFIVKNGKRPKDKILPRPRDMPPC